MIETSTQSGNLTRQAVETLSARRREPEWLLQLRLEALAAYERIPLEDQPTGNWRRTNLAGLDLASPTLTAVPTQSTPPLQPLSDLQVEGQAAALTQRDGADVARWIDPDLERRGIRVLSLEAALADPSLEPRVREHLGSRVAPWTDKLTALHYAFLNGGVVVYVPRNVVIEQPIQLRYESAESGLGGFFHTLVIAEESSALGLLEAHASQEGSAPVACAVTEMAVGPNAQVRYAEVQEWSPQTWAFAYQRATLDQDAGLRLFDAGLGGRQTRNTVQIILDGKGSQADLLGVVVGGGRQHVDFQTLQDHFGDHTRSDLVIHNGLFERSSSNFTGLIRINPVAHATESSQQQKNVLLSPKAKADSDPKLEILNNDVIRCTHGAAVGPVDSELVFYLQSRGLDHDAAQALILEGFFQAVIEKLKMPALQAGVWSAVRRKLQTQEH